LTKRQKFGWLRSVLCSVCSTTEVQYWLKSYEVWPVSVSGPDKGSRDFDKTRPRTSVKKNFLQLIVCRPITSGNLCKLHFVTRIFSTSRKTCESNHIRSLVEFSMILTLTTPFIPRHVRSHCKRIITTVGFQRTVPYFTIIEIVYSL
jgi:hypothetical protein